MYLHIGNGVAVRKKDVIGIFDLDTATVSNQTKTFIAKKQKMGEVEYDDDDLPRSFLLTEENKGYKIKLSRISSVGLKKRIEENIEVV